MKAQQNWNACHSLNSTLPPLCACLLIKYSWNLQELMQNQPVATVFVVAFLVLFQQKTGVINWLQSVILIPNTFNMNNLIIQSISNTVYTECKSLWAANLSFSSLNNPGTQENAVWIPMQQKVKSCISSVKCRSLCLYTKGISTMGKCCTICGGGGRVWMT